VVALQQMLARAAGAKKAAARRQEAAVVQVTAQAVQPLIVLQQVGAHGRANLPGPEPWQPLAALGSCHTATQGPGAKSP
jgi:hypothetical protein